MGGVNLYGFCGNNGVNAYDYLGMTKAEDDAAADAAARGRAWGESVMLQYRNYNSGGGVNIGGLPTSDSLMYGGFRGLGDTAWMGMYWTGDDEKGKPQYSWQDPRNPGSHGLADHLFGFDDRKWGEKSGGARTATITMTTVYRDSQGNLRYLGNGKLVPADQVGKFTADAPVSSGLPSPNSLSGLFRSNPFSSNPTYDPGHWNDGGSRNDGITIQGNSNCYAYACNQEGPFASEGGFGVQPGNKGLDPITLDDYTVEGIRRRAVEDGLNPNSMSGGYPVYLVFLPNENPLLRDYHWYRQDSDGTWSHKPGASPATNLDASGNVIRNPTTANHGDYTQQGGYLWVPPGFHF